MSEAIVRIVSVLAAVALAVIFLLNGHPGWAGFFGIAGLLAEARWEASA